jgi:hypothetical protein
MTHGFISVTVATDVNQLLYIICETISSASADACGPVTDVWWLGSPISSNATSPTHLLETDNRLFPKYNRHSAIDQLRRDRHNGDNSRLDPS